MTVKQFFKSKSFKCIAALLSILLVCGVFLTVMYGFLEVSAEERFSRAINKIYGQEVTTEEINIDRCTSEFEYSTVIEAYKVTDDGNYLIKMEGREGFAGTVTCWVVVEMSEDGKTIEGIKKIVIDNAPSESYISKIKQSHLDELATKAEYGKELEGGFIHGSSTTHGEDYVKTGASCSMRAISNAVNGAMEFVDTYLDATSSCLPGGEE